MEERIALHRERRDGAWQTVDAPHELAEAIAREATPAAILLDCLTLWLTSRLLARRRPRRGGRPACRHVAGRPLPGGGGVERGRPVHRAENALARRFRDEAGRLNQKVAAVADEAWFVAAGLPLRLK